MATEPMKLYNCIFDPPLPDDPVERANRLKELGMTELPPATDPQAQTLAPLLTMSERRFEVFAERPELKAEVTALRAALASETRTNQELRAEIAGKISGAREC